MKQLLLFAILIVGCDLYQEEDCKGIEIGNYNPSGQGNDRACLTDAATEYADEHWDLGRWIHDYYNWREYKEGDDEWNSIRNVFANSIDTLLGCAQSEPEPGALLHCYIDIWDYTNDLEIIFQGDTISSNSESQFKELYQELCGNDWVFERDCNRSIDDIQDLLIEKSVSVSKTHHHYNTSLHYFYLDISKYNMFTAGWDDTDSIYVITNDIGSKTAMTPHKLNYRGLVNFP